MQSSKLTDKTKRRIRIVVTDKVSDRADYNNFASSTAAPVADTDQPTIISSQTNLDAETKRLNIDYNDEFEDVLILSSRNKNDKNWENWERIREQKLEKMKNICFESYRQSKRDRLLQAKPKPKQLDPTWYTDNIYSNRSDDQDEDYVPDCVKYRTYRTLHGINEQDEKYLEDDQFTGNQERRGEGEGSSCYGLQRSKSCKEFQYPKSQSWCFEGNVFETGGGAPSATGPPTTSILKNRTGVPKSYSFSATTKTMPFDVIDYKLPPTVNARRDKQDAYRRKMNMICSSSLDERALAYSCCAREQCTSPKCLLDDIYPCFPEQRIWRRGMYSTGASNGSNRNLQRSATTAPIHGNAADWLYDERGDHRSTAVTSCYQLHLGSEHGQRMVQPLTSLQPTVICCCATDDYCYHRQQQRLQHAVRSRSRVHCPGHHPAAEEEEHIHCHYDTDLEHFITDERERLLLQDKFLDDDERYLSAAAGLGPTRHYSTNYNHATRNKTLLEVQPPSRYDEDTCSDTTEIDLEDFNIDLEKYWEQLDKPPSPINVDLQRRNMRSNLKVKNVNVRCYNNGQPIELHDREHERLMIKKSLLEGMPSPPQLDSSGSSNNVSSFPFFDSGGPPLPCSGYGHIPAYGHKVYPSVDTPPSYQYNNFYPEHTVGNVLTEQPAVGIHHTSAGGNSALSLINNIFSIYKPNKYSPENCQLNYETKPEPCKKMNVPSTRRPLGASHADYMHSMKRPLLITADQPHFKIIPEKTGLKISPLLTYDEYDGVGIGLGDKAQPNHRLSSTARPLMLPH